MPNIFPNVNVVAHLVVAGWGSCLSRLAIFKQSHSLKINVLLHEKLKIVNARVGKEQSMFFKFFTLINPSFFHGVSTLVLNYSSISSSTHSNH